MGPKTVLKRLNDSDVNNNVLLNDHMLKKVQKAIDDHNKDIVKEKQLNALHVKMLKYGLLRIQYAIQTTTKKSTIMDSFKETGIYPYNFDKIFHNFTNKMPLKPTFLQKEEIKGRMKELMELMVKGEIFDSELDNIGFWSDENDNDKDKLIVSQRRFVFLTNSELVGREHQRNLDKIELASAAEQKKKDLLEKREAKKAKKEADELLKAVQSAEGPTIDSTLAADDKATPVQAKSRKRKLSGPSVPHIEVVAPEDNLLCYCKCEYNENDELGSMIQCSNESKCTYGEWFHCVHVGKEDGWTTDGEWYCYACSCT